MCSTTVFGGLFATVGGGVASAQAVTPTTVTLPTGQTATNIHPGGTAQPAADWQFTVDNTFTAGETIVIDVGPGSGALPDQCNSATDFVGFAGVPTVNVTPGTTTPTAANTTPSITATTQTNPTDGAGCQMAGIRDQLVLTVRNSPSGGAATWTVTVSGIAYNVGAETPAAATGTPVGVSGANTSGVTGATPVTLTVEPNAILRPVAVTANTPPVGVQIGRNGAISNIVITEFVPGQVGPGEVTVTLPAGVSFTGTPTVTATNAAVSNAAAGTFGPSATLTPVAGTPNELVFFVEAPSTTPATFTISGLTVDVGTGVTPGPQQVTVNYNGVNTLTTVAFAAIGATRTAGFTADDTAAASLEKAFGSGTGNTMARNCHLFNTSVVLTSDFTPFDALSANYLARFLGTGVLITGFNTLSPAAANAIRQQGVGCVYIVGGTLAVSSAVQTQLQSTSAFFPGGTTAVPGLLGPTTLSVTRIAGFTADETAGLVAQYPGLNASGVLPATPGAYGAFNTTTGTGSTSGPTTTNIPGFPRTAILATDITFQDALSSGPLSYYASLPVLLTPQASLSDFAAAAITNLGIEQVIIVGGPAAVSNNVTSQLEALGVSVLRIAGLTYSDTSVQMANFELNHMATGLNPVVSGLAVCDGGPGIVASSRGDFFADALTSAAATVLGPSVRSTGCDFSPMLLTQNTSTPGPEVLAFLAAAGSTAGIGSLGIHIYSIDFYGGTLAQTPALVQAMLNAIATG